MNLVTSYHSHGVSSYSSFSKWYIKNGIVLEKPLADYTIHLCLIKLYSWKSLAHSVGSGISL